MITQRAVSLDRVRDSLRDAMGEIIGGLMAEPDVTDIMLNPPLAGEPDGRIWVSRLGRDREPVGFMAAARAASLIGAVASTMGQEATEETPNVQGHLLTDGSRFNGCVPPIVAAPCFAIRKHASAIFTLADYVASGQMTEHQRVVIEDAIRARKNIIICGGTGAGKTTLMNGVVDAMVRINPEHRFFGIEDTKELRCLAPDQTFTVTSPTMTMRQLVVIAMRNFPDRILIGETRGAEMLDILMAWNTGHPGGAATIHSDTTTPDAALRRIELLLMLATQSPMTRLIADAVHLIVCIERIGGSRRVTRIVSVLGHDGHSYQLEAEV